jgi:phosphohistidine phosphatase
MLLLLMRHGIAEPNSERYADDSARPLSEKGLHRTRAVAFGLKQLVPSIDMLATSPKLRATQTATIVRDVFADKAPKPKTWDELNAEPGEALVKKLRALKVETVLLVGHEPYLRHCASLLLAGAAGEFNMDWKKAGVCAIEFDPESGQAVLHWFLGSNALRKIGLA